jgi:CDP-paratose 2-epimerase
MRSYFFGPEASTRPALEGLKTEVKQFENRAIDIRDFAALRPLFEEHGRSTEIVVHTAAQPSHDWAAKEPFTDFGVNAVGTLNLLEAARLYCPEAVFIFTSTNKVYGDTPNRLPLVEQETRWEIDAAHPYHADGIDETMSIDQTKHSIFGASKVAADVMVQEYGRYFGLKSCALRGGCLTGPSHSGVELHGFLSYLVKCNVEGRTYRIFGYKGKQVRDNIHSKDVARFVDAFIAAPRPGEVYNLGGGKQNACSILEAFRKVEARSGRAMVSEYDPTNRVGDHICYYSDLTKMRSHFPGWDIMVPLGTIFDEIVDAWRQRDP